MNSFKWNSEMNTITLRKETNCFPKLLDYSANSTVNSYTNNHIIFEVLDISGPSQHRFNCFAQDTDEKMKENLS